MGGQGARLGCQQQVKVDVVWTVELSAGWFAWHRTRGWNNNRAAAAHHSPLSRLNTSEASGCGRQEVLTLLWEHSLQAAVAKAASPVSHVRGLALPCAHRLGWLPMLLHWRQHICRCSAAPSAPPYSLETVAETAGRLPAHLDFMDNSRANLCHRATILLDGQQRLAVNEKQELMSIE